MAWKKRVYKKARRVFNRKIAKPYVTGNPKRTRKARMNLYSEISAIKKLINVEKKRNVISYNTDLAVGQVIGNAAGWYATDITPIASQGDNDTQRNGASFKLTGSHMLFQVRQQASTASAVNMRIQIFRIYGNIVNPATFVDDIYFLNTFVLNAGSPAIIDMNSQLDINKQKGYQLVASKKIHIPYDAQSGILGVKQFKIGIKHKNHHVRYDGNTNTITNGQLVMVIMCDAGNASGTTASTLTGGITTTAVNTGLLLNYNITHYFVDN